MIYGLLSTCESAYNLILNCSTFFIEPTYPELPTLLKTSSLSSLTRATWSSTPS
jgi:hypothetical protein